MVVHLNTPLSSYTHRQLDRYVYSIDSLTKSHIRQFGWTKSGYLSDKIEHCSKASSCTTNFHNISQIDSVSFT